MEAEAKPLLDSLQLQQVVPVQEQSLQYAPFHLYQGDYKGKQVAVVTNGIDKRFKVDNVGTIAASLSTFHAVHAFHPDIIINAGTAGGFKKVGAAIGDAFIGTTICFHDRRIPIPGFQEYGIGNYSSAQSSNLVQSLGFKSGVVTTSNSLDHSEMDDQMMTANNASVKDMEAASVAYIAEITNTPFLALKVVTDIVDGDKPTQEEFLENLSTAAISLQQKIPLLIDFIVGKKLSDL